MQQKNKTYFCNIFVIQKNPMKIFAVNTRNTGFAQLMFAQS